MSVELEKIEAGVSWQIFEDAAQRELGMSGDEFVVSWDAGRFATDDDTRVMRVAMLRPSGR